MLEVSIQQLRRSWYRQENTARKITDDDASRRMLLYYAVECGSKYMYMDRNKYRLYKRHVPESDRAGHDIKRLMKNLGLESKCIFPDLDSKFEEKVKPDKYQEMWRYGIDCNDADEKGKIIEENMLKALDLLHDLEARR